MNEAGGRYFRAIFAADPDGALAPGGRPENRFHHDGQPALYLSETIEGGVTAMRTRLAPTTRNG